MYNVFEIDFEDTANMHNSIIGFFFPNSLVKEIESYIGLSRKYTLLFQYYFGDKIIQFSKRSIFSRNDFYLKDNQAVKTDHMDTNLNAMK